MKLKWKNIGVDDWEAKTDKYHYTVKRDTRDKWWIAAGQCTGRKNPIERMMRTASKTFVLACGACDRHFNKNRRV